MSEETFLMLEMESDIALVGFYFLVIVATFLLWWGFWSVLDEHFLPGFSMTSRAVYALLFGILLGLLAAFVYWWYIVRLDHNKSKRIVDAALLFNVI